MNKFKNANIRKLVIGMALLTTTSSYAENEAKLAEDPFLLEQAQKQEKNTERPWDNRTPQELRTWAKKNLHHKITAKKVIDAKAHPEWDWFRKSGLGLFLHWGLTSENPATGDAWAMVWSEQKMKHNRFMQSPEEMFKVAETWNPSNYDPD